MSSILKSTSNVVESLAAAEVRKRQKRGDKEEKGREERERKAIGDNTLGRQFAGKKKKTNHRRRRRHLFFFQWNLDRFFFFLLRSSHFSLADAPLPDPLLAIPMTK